MMGWVTAEKVIYLAGKTAGGDCLFARFAGQCRSGRYGAGGAWR